MRKILLHMLILCMVFMTGCTWLWPEEVATPAQPPGANDPLPRLGSFVPQVIPASGENLRLRTVYLLDHHGRYLVPYVLSIPRVEGVARETISRLIDSSQNSLSLLGTELRLPLPATTELRGLTIRDGRAIIDFTEGFLAFQNALHERLAIDAVLYTMTEFENVDEVELWVDGNPLTALPSGQSLPAILSREIRELNLEVLSTVSDPNQGSRVRIYFSASGPSGSFLYFVPVTRVIPQTSDLMAAAVHELIRGPLPGSNLMADIPAATALQGVQLAGDTVYVDFSREVLTYAGSAAEQAVLGALVLTLTDMQGVHEVRITVNGQTPSLPHGFDISRPISRPIYINPFIL